MSEWFKALKGKVKHYDLLGFDIEGVGGPDGFLCGAIVGETIYNFFTDRDDMMKALLHYGADGFRLYSHNLQYDLPILEGGKFPSGDMLFTPSGLLWADYGKGKQTIRFYDSANLFPRLSIAAIGKTLQYPKFALDEELMRRIVRKTPWEHFIERDQNLIRKYCERDAEIVFMAVSALQDLLNNLGANLSSTIAGCSMDLYRRVYHKWPWMIVPDNINRVSRAGYYGGRVENFVMGKIEPVNMYDVTSLYPAMMRWVKFPHPNHLEFDLEPNIGGDWIDREGVAYVDMDIPHYYIPLLPKRTGSRIFYPYGKIEGAWPIIEIRHAIDYGAQLNRVDWVMGSKVTFNPFVRFVEDLFTLRDQYIQSGSMLSNIVKLLLNSLYGRFGINPDVGLSKLIYLESGDQLESLPGYSTVEINDVIYAYGPASFGSSPAYANVLFAAQVTGAGRAYMLDYMIDQGENMVYTDTDSIITRSTVTTGDGLGEFRTQMTNGSADMIGPKEYMLHNEIFGTKYAAKGIPEGSAADYLRSGVARFQRAIGIKEAIRSRYQPSEWIEVFRSHKEIVPKRYPAGHPDNEPGDWVITYPYHSSELVDLSLGFHGFPEIDRLTQERFLPFPRKAQQLNLF